MASTVDYITYKEGKYPIRVGYYALKKLKALGKDITNLDEGDFELYEDLLFYSLEQGHRIEDKEFSFERKDMEMVLDLCFTEFLPKVQAFFQEMVGVMGAQTNQEQNFSQMVKEAGKQKRTQKKK